MAIDFNKAKDFIALCEMDFFSGAFSESVIRADLENRKAMDRLSTMGSSGMQTNELRNKKNYYIQDFDNCLSGITQVLDWARNNHWDTMFISRCERCKEQVNKLHDIVRNFH